jgi:hypothetical protein
MKVHVTRSRKTAGIPWEVLVKDGWSKMVGQKWLVKDGWSKMVLVSHGWLKIVHQRWVV